MLGRVKARAPMLRSESFTEQRNDGNPQLLLLLLGNTFDILAYDPGRARGSYENGFRRISLPGIVDGLLELAKRAEYHIRLLQVCIDDPDILDFMASHGQSVAVD
ncbi:hypothetical protein D3C71_1515760 [compost metagenome]